jgi:hypothetical protein
MHKFVEPMTVGLIGVLLTFTACGVPNQPEVQSHSLCASRGRSSEPCNIIQGISANGIGEQVVGASIGGGEARHSPIASMMTMAWLPEVSIITPVANQS